MQENTKGQPAGAPGQDAPELTEKAYNELVSIRRGKLKELQDAGQDPFAITLYPQDSFAASIQQQYAAIAPEEKTGHLVCMRAG